MTDETILEEKGREANRDLSFRKWSASKHAQYFTPLKIANLILSMVKACIKGEDKSLEKVRVLDPTAGTGRLLYPFKREDAKVLGIEFDKDLIDKAKMLLGKEAVRHGSILDYAPYLRGQDFDIAVTNPPYGLIWNQDESPFQFEEGSLSYARNIESQSGTLQICEAALKYSGLLFAIIPTSTFTNAKDDGFRQFLFKEFTVLFRVSLGKLFKDEYGIDVEVDLFAARNMEGYQTTPARQTFPALNLDPNDPLLEVKVLDEWKKVLKNVAVYGSDREITVPHLDNLLEINHASGPAEITVGGIKGNPLDQAMIGFLEKTLKIYNPVVGKPTGLITSFLDPPALFKRGADPAMEILNSLGFTATITDKTRAKIQNQAEKFKVLSIPIYKPRDHQRLAYFEEKEYKARADVYDNQEESEYRQDHRGNGGNGHTPNLLFTAGKKYLLRPTWNRNKETVNVEMVGEGSDQKIITTEIDRGFLTIEVETEQGKREFREPEAVEIASLLEAFELPEVRDISEERPAQVKAWKDKLLKRYPHIFTQEFEYQADDLSRILAKTKSAYIGWDMGGGKSCAAMAFQAIRGVCRVLIICQSSLIENWLNEARKFGFNAQRITTHSSVDELQAEIRCGKKTEGTTFYITSYEFLSLDTGRVYDPWDCIKYDKDGNVIHDVKANTSRTCRECSREFLHLTSTCPKCEAKEEWTGNHCKKCGYSAYTYSGQSIEQYPAYKRIKKLFGAVIVDESQQAKSKTSFRGQAVRAIKARSRLELTGTLMKGYITDTFFNIGFITRHNNPLFPYRFDGRGSKMFAEEFSTFEYKDIQFDETLHKGRRKELPEVSNLNRFWKILGAFAVRRLKDEMVQLPDKTRRIFAVAPSAAHASEYGDTVADSKEKIDRELRKPQEQINMGVISKALWAMRFAATIPHIGHDKNMKLQKAVQIAKDAREKGEKVLVYSALREMQTALHGEFTRHGISHIYIPSTVQAKDRFRLIKEFQERPEITAIIAGLNVLNRGWTITAANHVIFTDVEYSPESTDQAEDRAHRTGQEKPVTCYYLLLDWPEEKENIDFKMYDLISAKKQAISNAIDGRVRFTSTAKVLSAGGDYLAIAKALTGKIEDERSFDVEREGPPLEAPAPTRPEAPPNNGLWEKMWAEKKEKEGEAKARVRTTSTNQLTLF